MAITFMVVITADTAKIEKRLMMFLAIDLETTGLDPKNDRILQVAWQLLNYDLSDRSELSTAVCDVSDETLRRLEANIVVLDMHTRTGLWAYLQDPSVVRLALPDIEDLILQDIYNAGVWQEPVNLLGASVHFDRGFIDNWMPRLSTCLHHRILDTSSLKLLAKSAGKEIPAENPHPHIAEFDVQESVDVARKAQRYFTGDRVLDA